MRKVISSLNPNTSDKGIRCSNTVLNAQLFLPRTPKEFDKSNFEGLYYERDEEAMIELLGEIGFDVSLIGLTPKQGGDTAEESPFAAAEDLTQNF